MLEEAGHVRGITAKATFPAFMGVKGRVNEGGLSGKTKWSKSGGSFNFLVVAARGSGYWILSNSKLRTR